MRGRAGRADERITVKTPHNEEAWETSHGETEAQQRRVRTDPPQIPEIGRRGRRCDGGVQPLYAASLRRGADRPAALELARRLRRRGLAEGDRLFQRRP